MFAWCLLQSGSWGITRIGISFLAKWLLGGWGPGGFCQGWVGGWVWGGLEEAFEASSRTGCEEDCWKVLHWLILLVSNIVLSLVIELIYFPEIWGFGDVLMLISLTKIVAHRLICSDKLLIGQAVRKHVVFGGCPWLILTPYLHHNPANLSKSQHIKWHNYMIYVRAIYQCFYCNVYIIYPYSHMFVYYHVYNYSYIIVLQL